MLSQFESKYPSYAKRIQKCIDDKECIHCMFSEDYKDDNTMYECGGCTMKRMFSSVEFNEDCYEKLECIHYRVGCTNCEDENICKICIGICVECGKEKCSYSRLGWNDGSCLIKCHGCDEYYCRDNPKCGGVMECAMCIKYDIDLYNEKVKQQKLEKERKLKEEKLIQQQKEDDIIERYLTRTGKKRKRKDYDVTKNNINKKKKLCN